MSYYLTIKHIHMLCALISISGFILRGIWMMTDSPLLQTRIVKKLPHAIDSLLLLSALIMVILSEQYPFVVPWVTAKIFALLAYIGFGLIALRFGKNKIQKSAAFCLAILTFAYIVLVALSKNVWFFIS